MVACSCANRWMDQVFAAAVNLDGPIIAVLYMAVVVLVVEVVWTSIVIKRSFISGRLVWDALLISVVCAEIAFLTRALPVSTTGLNVVWLAQIAKLGWIFSHLETLPATCCFCRANTNTSSYQGEDRNAGSTLNFRSKKDPAQPSSISRTLNAHISALM